MKFLADVWHPNGEHKSRVVASWSWF
jgi:hypothetical protein